MSCDTMHATQGVVIHCTQFLVHIKRVQGSNFDQGTMYICWNKNFNVNDLLTGMLAH